MRRLSCLLIVLVSCLSPAAALATRCARWDADTLVSKVALLFEGTLIDVEIHRTYPTYVASTFRVDTPHKGDLGEAIRILHHSNNGLDGVTFKLNQPVMVAAFGDPVQGYTTNICLDWMLTRAGQPSVVAAVQQYRQRLAALDLAIADAPEIAEPLIAKARFLADTNAGLAAVDVLQQVLSRDPANRTATLLAAELLVSHKSDGRAVDVLGPYLRSHPNDTEARRIHAHALARLGRKSELPPDWRDYAGLKGNHIDLAGLNLDGASFAGARVMCVRLGGARLDRSDFSNAHLPRAELPSASLKGAILTGATLVDANLVGADLRGAYLGGALLDRAFLTDAVYDGTTVWPSGFDPVRAGAKQESDMLGGVEPREPVRFQSPCRPASSTSSP